MGKKGWLCLCLCMHEGQEALSAIPSGSEVPLSRYNTTDTVSLHTPASCAPMPRGAVWQKRSLLPAITGMGCAEEVG